MIFYITLPTKKELEDKINELDGLLKSESFAGAMVLQSHIDTYKEILSNCVVLPDEPTWDLSVVKLKPYQQEELRVLYPNGVIIKKRD
jgi:hypothetical protein